MDNWTLELIDSPAQINEHLARLPYNIWSVRRNTQVDADIDATGERLRIEQLTSHRPARISWDGQQLQITGPVETITATALPTHRWDAWSNWYSPHASHQMAGYSDALLDNGMRLLWALMEADPEPDYCLSWLVKPLAQAELTGELTDEQVELFLAFAGDSDWAQVLTGTAALAS